MTTYSPFFSSGLHRPYADIYTDLAPSSSSTPSASPTTTVPSAYPSVAVSDAPSSGRRLRKRRSSLSLSVGGISTSMKSPLRSQFPRNSSTAVGIASRARSGSVTSIMDDVPPSPNPTSGTRERNRARRVSMGDTLRSRFHNANAVRLRSESPVPPPNSPLPPVPLNAPSAHSRDQPMAAHPRQQLRDGDNATGVFDLTRTDELVAAAHPVVTGGPKAVLDGTISESPIDQP